MGIRTAAAGDPDWMNLSKLYGSDGTDLQTVLVDTTGQLYALMKGEYGGSYVPIAVDSSGNIVSLMKGEYAGSLKTIATDVDGRMIAKIIDVEDVWGQERIMGNAEVVESWDAPPSPYDRRGTKMYWDDYKSGSKKYYPEIKAASGGTVGRTTTNPHFDDFCLKLTTGATTDDWVRAYYTVNDFHVGKISAQFSFATQATNATIKLDVTYTDGALIWTAALDYNLSTDLLRYYGDDGAYHNIDTIPYYKGAASEIIPYSTIKLVADFNTKYYTRSLFFGEEDNLSAHGIKSDAMVVDPGIIIKFQLTTNANTAYTAYLDGMIMKEAEPV